MFTGILIIGLFALGVLLPPWFNLIFGYLAVRATAWMIISAPLISIGYIDIFAGDIFYAGIVTRVFLNIVAKKRILFDLKMVWGVILFWFIMLLSTLFAVRNFGWKYALRQMISLLRFLVIPLSSLLFMAALRWNEKILRQSLKWWRWTGYIVAGTVYLGWIFGVGEINRVEGSTSLRYQGLLGDSVKLALLPFIFCEMAYGSIAGSAFLIGALLLTGGRFGVFGLLVGLIFLLWRNRRILLRSKALLCLVVLSKLFLVGLIYNIGGMRTRLFNATIVWHGIGRRMVTWGLGLRIGKDYWGLGAGFNAYSFLYYDYLSAASISFLPFATDFVPFATEAYSQIVKVFVDSGVVGVGAFVLLMLNFWRKTDIKMSQSQRAYKKFVIGAQASVFVFIVLSPFVVWLNAGSIVGFIFMIMMGLVLAVNRVRTYIVVSNNDVN